MAWKRNCATDYIDCDECEEYDNCKSPDKTEMGQIDSGEEDI